MFGRQKKILRLEEALNDIQRRRVEDVTELTKSLRSLERRVLVAEAGLDFARDMAADTAHRLNAHELREYKRSKK